MITLYLAALVLGLGTIALQFVLSHAGGGPDGGVDAHGDVGAEGHLLADAGGHVSDGVEHGDHAAAPGGGDRSAASETASLFLSMRFWTYALMCFGLVGSAVHALHLAGAIVALGASVVAGLGGGLAASMIFRALRPSVSSATTRNEAIGRLAHVIVPISAGGIGKVRLQLRGRTVDMLAVTDAAQLEQGQEVVVVEFRDQHLLVEPVAVDSER